MKLLLSSLLCLGCLLLPSSTSALTKLPKVTHKAYIDVEMEGEPIGRINFGLWGEEAPKTVASFLALCRGDRFSTWRKEANGDPTSLTFVGSIFHRIIPGFGVQTGDVTMEEGRGGDTIYGRRFPDEESALRIKHDRPFILNMANSGPDTNGSQFFIVTADKCPWLDGKHMLFGEVLGEESKAIVKLIESKGSKGGKPEAHIVIVGAGEIPTENTGKALDVEAAAALAFY